METVGGPETGPDAVSGPGAAMERFGGGMALLPWTRQILTVLWEQLRLLVQVIYYTFISGTTSHLLEHTHLEHLSCSHTWNTHLNSTHHLHTPATD